MITILNIHAAHGYIQYPVQIVNSPESFLHLKESYPDENFMAADELSQMELDKFTELLAFLGWSADDWWAYGCCKKQTINVYAHVNKVVFDLLTWDHIDGDICYCSTLQSFRDLQRFFPEKRFEISNDAKCALEGAIDYFLGSNGKVEYLADSLSFRITEYTPKPVYYGGSIDSIDFDEDVYECSLEDALERHLSLEEGERIYNPWFNRWEEEEIELPF